MKYTSAEIAKEIFNSSLNMVDVILYDGTLMVVQPGWGSNLRDGYSCILSNWEIDRDEYEDVDDYIEFNKEFIQEELDQQELDQQEVRTN